MLLFAPPNAIHTILFYWFTIYNLIVVVVIVVITIHHIDIHTHARSHTNKLSHTIVGCAAYTRACNSSLLFPILSPARTQTHTADLPVCSKPSFYYFSPPTHTHFLPSKTLTHCCPTPHTLLTAAAAPQGCCCFSFACVSCLLTNTFSSSHRSSRDSDTEPRELTRSRATSRLTACCVLTCFLWVRSLHFHSLARSLMRVGEMVSLRCAWD